MCRKTRQWAYIELDLQCTPPKSHINIKNDGFSKCISGFKYGVILGIHVSFRGVYVNIDMRTTAQTIDHKVNKNFNRWASAPNKKEQTGRS